MFKELFPNCNPRLKGSTKPPTNHSSAHPTLNNDRAIRNPRKKAIRYPSSINPRLQLTLPQDDALEWSSLSENRRRCLRLQLGKTYEDDVNLTVLHEAFLDCQRNYSVYLDSVENVVRSLGLLEQVKNETEVLRLVKDLRFTVEDILRILEVGVIRCSSLN